MDTFFFDKKRMTLHEFFLSLFLAVPLIPIFWLGHVETWFPELQQPFSNHGARSLRMRIQPGQHRMKNQPGSLLNPWATGEGLGLPFWLFHYTWSFSCFWSLIIWILHCTQLKAFLTDKAIDNVCHLQEVQAVGVAISFLWCAGLTVIVVMIALSFHCSIKQSFWSTYGVQEKAEPWLWRSQHKTPAQGSVLNKVFPKLSYDTEIYHPDYFNRNVPFPCINRKKCFADHWCRWWFELPWVVQGGGPGGGIWRCV